MTAYLHRCPCCRTRRSTRRLMLQHHRVSGCPRRPCYCEGYPFPHRPGGRLCALNPMYLFYRSGGQEVPLELPRHTGSECPF